MRYRTRFLAMTLFWLVLLISCSTISVADQEHPTVVVHEAQHEQWHDSLEALGTLRANETVVLTAAVTDTITKIHFDDGQRVESGYVLAEMTDSEESALVSEMSVRVGEAKRQFARLKNLPKSGAISASLYDQRKREYDAARAQLEAMKSRLKDRLIVAPFDGVIGLRNISVGALVVPGNEIATLTDDSVMKLDFSLPAVYLAELSIGLPVAAVTKAYPGAVFSGVVSAIDSTVDAETRSIQVRAKIPNEKSLLRPGLLMNVRLSFRARNALVVPEEAILPKQQERSVLVVHKDTKVVERRAVDTGTRKKGFVEITKGLEAGELVITDGTMVARPGGTVQIGTPPTTGQGEDSVTHGAVQ